MSWRADWIISTEEFFSQSFSLEAGENQIIWHKSLSMSFIKFIFVFIIMKFRLRKLIGRRETNESYIQTPASVITIDKEESQDETVLLTGTDNE